MTSINRVVSDLTLDPARRLERLRNEVAFDELGELEQQFQINVSGVASDTIAWTGPIALDFDVHFVNARYQRYSNLSVPHFTWGYTSTNGQLICVMPNLITWTRDSRDIIHGAVLHIGAYVPGGFGIGFTGTVHLAFQGYGSVSEFSTGS